LTRPSRSIGRPGRRGRVECGGQGRQRELTATTADSTRSPQPQHRANRLLATGPGPGKTVPKRLRIKRLQVRILPSAQVREPTDRPAAFVGSVPVSFAPSTPAPERRSRRRRLRRSRCLRCPTSSRPSDRRCVGEARPARVGTAGSSRTDDQPITSMTARAGRPRTRSMVAAVRRASCRRASRTRAAGVAPSIRRGRLAGPVDGRWAG
jgi:hypothetical protein